MTTDTPRRGRKRGDGEGSIRRRADGMWRGEVMVGYRPDGKPDRRYVYAKTRGECQDKLDDLRRRARSGLLADGKVGRESVGAFLDAWLLHIDGTIGAETLRRYRDNVKHLKGAFGRRRLADLRPEDLVKLYAAKRAERDAGGEPAYSARTVRYMHTTIRKALALAVEWGYVPLNVASRVKGPRVPRAEVAFMDPAEVRRLLDSETERGHRLAELWTVAVGTGARSGELRGLLWKDVDLDLGTVSVRRTLERVDDGRPVFKETKTPRSRRTIRISAESIAAFRRQKDRQDFERRTLGDAYADSGLVFAGGDGRPLIDTSVSHAYKKALERAGLPRTYRVHDLRHAHATLLLKAGVHVKVVSERLGHASTAFTMDVYSHVLEGMDADAADRLEGVLRAAI